jgi:hypothetical protein
MSPPEKAEDTELDKEKEKAVWFLALGLAESITISSTETLQDAEPKTDFIQGNLFEEPEQKTTTFENVLTMAAPIIQTVKGKKEWTCMFTAPPDLWHQDRNELIHARARDEEVVKMASRARLQAGDFVTLTGIVTQEQELMRAGKPTKLTYVNLTEIRPGLRASSPKNSTVKKKTGRTKPNPEAI